MQAQATALLKKKLQAACMVLMGSCLHGVDEDPTL
jgi:hypothetical protein